MNLQFNSSNSKITESREFSINISKKDEKTTETPNVALLDSKEVKNQQKSFLMQKINL